MGIKRLIQFKTCSKSTSLNTRGLWVHVQEWAKNQVIQKFHSRHFREFLLYYGTNCSIVWEVCDLDLVPICKNPSNEIQSFNQWIKNGLLFSVALTEVNIQLSAKCCCGQNLTADLKQILDSGVTSLDTRSTSLHSQCGFYKECLIQSKKCRYKR